MFGNDMNTDVIISGRYLSFTDPKEWARHCMEAIRPDFPSQASPGDIIVAGSNFGCGSSREQAPSAIKALGISVVIADSFARIFFRNSINIGLPVLECPGMWKSVREGMVLEVDLKEGVIRCEDGKDFRAGRLPPNVMEILEAGGLINKLKAELASKGTLL